MVQCLPLYWAIIWVGGIHMTDTGGTVLKKEYADGLYEYQKERINEIYEEFQKLNAESVQHSILYCPKCGALNPPLTKGGCTKSYVNKRGILRPGKPMFKCGCCRKRFVVTTGTLQFHSRQDAGKWADFIKATMEGRSIEESAKLIKVSERTAFRMRHKLLSFLDALSKQELEEKPLANIVEMDEIYFHEAHKGLELHEIASMEDEIVLSYYDPDNWFKPEDDTEAWRSNLREQITEMRAEERQRKRGISDQKACMVTGVERRGKASLLTTNMAKPTSDDIRKIMPTIEDETSVFIDGQASYFQVLKEKDCPFTVCPSKESYTAVNHLNNVNSLHDKIRDRMKKYRGVSTIYLNRYAAMFYMMHKFASCGIQEMTLMILKGLSHIQHYFFYHQQDTVGIFDDPLVMEHRSDRVSAFDQMRYRKDMLATFKARMA